MEHYLRSVITAHILQTEENYNLKLKTWTPRRLSAVEKSYTVEEKKHGLDKFWKVLESSRSSFANQPILIYQDAEGGTTSSCYGF